MTTSVPGETSIDPLRHRLLAFARLGDRSMVGHTALDRGIGVRIPVSQPLNYLAKPAFPPVFSKLDQASTGIRTPGSAERSPINTVTSLS